MNFSQHERLKRKTTFLLVLNRFFSRIWTNEKFVFFLNAQTEKNSWKEIGENKIGDFLV
jgi:hypothetical protein